MPLEFTYQDIFSLGDDTTKYHLLSKEHISISRFEDQPIIKIDPEALTLLAEEAFKDVSHLLRTSHLQQMADILKDPDASDNDRYVALEMLKNAVISAEGVFPMCQDTGTAIVIGKKGQGVWTGFVDEEAVSRGIFNAYTTLNLRYSQNAPFASIKAGGG